MDRIKKKDPIFDLWSLCVTLKLQTWVLHMTHCVMMVTFLPSNFKIHQGITKLWIGQNVYTRTHALTHTHTHGQGKHYMAFHHSLNGGGGRWGGGKHKNTSQWKTYECKLTMKTNSKCILHLCLGVKEWIREWKNNDCSLCTFSFISHSECTKYITFSLYTDLRIGK